MSSKGRNFNDLARPIKADPVRAARLAAEREAVVGEHLAYSLNEIRQELGITQADMADALGVSQPAISQALHKASMSTLRALVEAMGAELEVTVKSGGRRFLVDA